MVLVIAIAYCSSLYSQTVGYAILNSKMSSSSNVILKLIVYGKSKKNRFFVNLGGKKSCLFVI